MSLAEKLYRVLSDSPQLTNAELEGLLGWSNDMVRKYKHQLKVRGIIDYTYGKPLQILRDYPTNGLQNPSLKSEIYLEMVQVYMEDFRNQENFNKRIIVGREIRLLLEQM